ncbi:MAG: hypothetical protein IKG47_00600 [Oscillospiraceae bacterium]|nr:hypothetical protein [Clostridiales bacterium]MBR3353845.1 hypothetical protein [Oscillospiraceae bacterium]
MWVIVIAVLIGLLVWLVVAGATRKKKDAYREIIDDWSDFDELIEKIKAGEEIPVGFEDIVDYEEVKDEENN